MAYDVVALILWILIEYTESFEVDKSPLGISKLLSKWRSLLRLAQELPQRVLANVAHTTPLTKNGNSKKLGRLVATYPNMLITFYGIFLITKLTHPL